jgi:hypothetical protein
VEAVFLRKSTGWCNARLSRNYSDLGGFQQFRTERQKPFPANSIGFLRKEKTRVFCEAAAPRKTARQKGPKGALSVSAWAPRCGDLPYCKLSTHLANRCPTKKSPNVIFLSPD